MVLTVLAPIASRVSTMMWVITMGPPSASITRTSRSRKPPPSRTSIGSHSSQMAPISALCSRIWIRAACGLVTPVSWICAIISDPETDAMKPPDS